MKLGAVNYLCKPASIDEIMRAFVDRNDNSMQQKENKIEPKRPSVERLEWEYIQKTLAENDGNISATARTLGMHRRTLQRKLQKKPVRS
jgi:two-component system response regulator RegA